MDNERVSLRKYAAMRGVYPNAVQAAIKAGRITRDANGKIDPLEADAQWEANTSKSKQPKSERKPPPARRELPIEPEEPAEPLDYNAERAKREHWAAKREQLDFEREAGLLVPASEIEDQWVKVAQTIRTKLLSLPTKARMRLPHLATEDVSTLDSLIRECLEELCERS